MYTFLVFTIDGRHLESIFQNISFLSGFDEQIKNHTALETQDKKIDKYVTFVR